MPRQKTDTRTQRLIADMGVTRAELGLVVEALVERGSTQGEIARAASWNSGYFSEFLKNSEKNPTPVKIENLIQALYSLLLRTAGVRTEAQTALHAVANRYGKLLARVANPAAGPLQAIASNYVHRLDMEEALTRAVGTPGSYAIDGQPMTGVSSALLLVEAMLREQGLVVCRISARDDLFESGRIKASQTGILGALAAAMISSDEPLEMEFYAVQEAIRERLTYASGGFALLVDDMNALDIRSANSLKSFVRDWATRRASGETAFANTTVWLAYTSNVSSASIRSQLVAEYVITRWFNKREVCTLADSFAPFMAGPVGNSTTGPWASGAAELAYKLFRGQPQLTHLYLWDCHNSQEDPCVDRDVMEKKALASAPTGAYERHLARVARSLVEILGPQRAAELLDGLTATGSVIDRASLAEHQMLERYGIVDEEGGWSCAYYRAHLPRLVKQGALGVQSMLLGQGAAS